jgi:hypothetical protein
MCSVDLNMGTVRGTEHIKTIFSFWPAIDKHWASGDSVTQPIHILHFSAISNVSYKPSEEKSRRVKSGE